jgi:hypothetical protein
LKYLHPHTLQSVAVASSVICLVFLVVEILISSSSALIASNHLL